MRLINNIPIRILHELILSRETFGTAKSFIAAGEKLKIAEQKLNFLKRCKRRQVFPVFILNSFSHQQSLFPICQSRNIQHHLKNLFTVVAFHAYIILCSIFSLVVVLGLYIIDYKSLSSYELTFVMNLRIAFFDKVD